MEIKLEGLTLANVSEGALEERFQDLLADVAEVNANAIEYVGNTNGERTSKIVLEVEVRYKPSLAGDPATTLIISGAELKRPKKMKTAQAAYSRDGVLLVEEMAPEQVEAFDPAEGRGGVVQRIATNQGGVEDGK